MRETKFGRSGHSVDNGARRKYNSPKCNSRLLGELSEKYAAILAQSRSGGQKTVTLEQSVSELSKVIAMQTPENSGNETQKQTMGVVESQVPIGYDSRNMGLILKTEPTKTEKVKRMRLV